MSSKDLPKKGNSRIKRLAYKYEKPLIVVIILVFIVLFDLFTPIAGGQIRYYAKWVSCGQIPEMVDSDFGNAIRYHKETSIISIVRTNADRYYCSAKEAELNGISADPKYFRYPLLTPEEIRTYVDKYRGP